MVLQFATGHGELSITLMCISTSNEMLADQQWQTAFFKCTPAA